MKKLSNLKFAFAPLKFCAFFIIAIISTTFSFGCSNSKKSIETDWSIQSQRSDIEPKNWVEGDILFDNEPTLALSGNGKAYVNGSWTKTYSVEANKVYKFTTHFKSEQVAQLDRSILAQITWLNKQGQRVGFKEFPAVKAKQTDGEWYIIEQSYEVPEEA